MQSCWHAIMEGFELSADACRNLDEAGFTIIPGPVPTQDLAELSGAYDAVLSDADPEDIRVGSLPPVLRSGRLDDRVQTGLSGMDT